MDIIHLLSGLQIGGLERAALRLARAGLEHGQAHGLVLYDRPFRSAALDFDPGPVPACFLPRGRGLDAGFIWRLARHLRGSGARVVHAHNDTALFYAVAAARLLGRRRPRVVGTFHSWPAQGSGRARLLNRLVAPLAPVAAVSQELADRLVQTGWLRRCGVIRNGIALPPPPLPDERQAWRRRLGVAGDAVLAGHVGRMDPVKRHQDLLAAAEALRDARPDLVFVLVGQGALLAEVQARAAQLGNVRVVPQVTDIPGLLGALDLFVLCSAHEGTPLALLEAMAAGLPPVATRVGGIPEMLGPDPAGLLVPPGNPAALAREIGRLAGDAGLRAALGAAARRRAADFSFEAEWAAYASLYAGTAGPGAGAGRLA